MRRIVRVFVPFVVVALVGACQGSQKTTASPAASARATASADPAPAGFRLTSTAFANNGAIPAQYACDGQSPPLAWAGAPAGASRLALVVEDPDAPSGLFTHWTVWDLPVTDGSLPAGGPLPFGTQEGLNSFGKPGYGGPCPPAGPAHHYHFKLFALDKPVGLDAGADRAALDGAMQGHVLAQAELVGTYAKK